MCKKHSYRKLNHTTKDSWQIVYNPTVMYISKYSNLFPFIHKYT